MLASNQNPFCSPRKPSRNRSLFSAGLAFVLTALVAYGLVLWNERRVIVIQESTVQYRIDYLSAILLALTVAIIVASVVYLLHRNFSLKREYIQQLKVMLAIDPLTSLGSRHLFKMTLDKLVQQCAASGEKFAVLMIDIDHFRRDVTDMFGHTVGDDILVEVAHRLSANSQDQDLLARYGNDEFMLVLRDVSDARSIELTARKLMAKITEFHVIDRKIRLTSSIGVSVFPSDAQDAETLMQHASLAVFEAKHRNGRDCVCIFKSRTA